MRRDTNVRSHADKKVRFRTFEPGDLVLKRVFPSLPHLGPKWEGPFVIQRKLEKGTFKLTTVDGEEVPRAWNAQHLMRYLD